MGIYLNPGNVNFTKMLRTGRYVDKTMMISVIDRLVDTEEQYVCMSRPRRFGKTVAGNMLCAYYSKGCDSRELFQPYKIAREYGGFEERLNKYNVIKIDMNSEYQNTTDRSRLMTRLTKEIKKEMKKQFPDVDIEDEDSLAQDILKVYEEKGETFILIIDEYDVLVRERAGEELFAEYLSFLNGLFKSDPLKNAISLAYVTGILPVVRDKIQSKLNNFDEYTIINAGPFAEYVGFTEDEVKKLCEKYGMDFDECRRWYDGYAQQGLEIYNPESVIKSMVKGAYGNYWGKTSSYEAITDRIRMNFDGTRDDVIRMLSGERVRVDVDMYLNTMGDFKSKDEVFSYLTHLGYLAYTEEDRTCWVPNKEVRAEWFRAISTIDDYSATDKIIKSSETLLRDTLEGNEEAVARALDDSHINVTSNRSYNNEDALQSAIYLSYIYALNKYTVVKEMTAGKGFSDVTFIPFVPDIPAMIIELKRNGSAASAMDQIRKKEYFRSLEKYSGNLLFVGIDYDAESKRHSCRIQRFVK